MTIPPPSHASDGVQPTHDLSQLDPETLERHLGVLIRQYVADRSAVLAQSVVSHIDALIGHPEVRTPALFCSYRRLAIHWRWLAAQHSGAPQSPS